MTAITATAGPPPRERLYSLLASQGVLVALLLLILFGAIRYDNFVGSYNVLSVLRYNSMFALVALGMCFVIMTGGIDLSVGSWPAMASVVSAILSPQGCCPRRWPARRLGRRWAAQRAAGHPARHPAVHRDAGDHAGGERARACCSPATSRSRSPTRPAFIELGQGDLLGFPTPAWIAGAAYLAGSLVLNYTGFGRHVLAVGGGEEASRLMGLSVDRVKLLTYLASGTLAGMAGVILASQFGAGQPPRAWAGSCSRSPRSWSAARCSRAAWARWAPRSRACSCSASSSTS
jgi:ribose transport system permease protein